MKKVLVTIPVEEKHKARLEHIAEDLQFIYCGKNEVSGEMVQEASYILGNVPAELLKDAGKLELMQLDSAGATPYTVEGVMPGGAQLANATGAYGLAIAEHMIASLLMLIKKLNRYQQNMINHDWKDEGKVASVSGSVTLVVGMGDIGGQFAQKMNALGSHVIGVRRNRSQKPEYLESLHQIEELDDLLGKADIVACSLPGTSETEGMFDASRVKKMKKGAIFLNVGRGNLISSDVLCEALKSGHLGGAAIDVAEQEPLPKESPLWVAPNLLITPHVSGSYHMQQILETIVDIAEYNLKAVISGRSIKNEVDFSTGYRKFIQ